MADFIAEHLWWDARGRLKRDRLGIMTGYSSLSRIVLKTDKCVHLPHEVAALIWGRSLPAVPEFAHRSILVCCELSAKAVEERSVGSKNPVQNKIRQRIRYRVNALEGVEVARFATYEVPREGGGSAWESYHEVFVERLRPELILVVEVRPWT